MRSEKRRNNIKQLKGNKNRYFTAVFVTVGLLGLSGGGFNGSFSNVAMASNQSAISGVRAMADGQWDFARAKVLKSQDPVAMMLYEWMVYKRAAQGLPFSKITGFIARHPHWPDQDQLKMAAEDALTSGEPAASVLAWFEQHPPVSGDGMLKYLAVLMAQGQTSKAQAVLNAGWADLKTNAASQKSIIQKYGRLISREAQSRRLDALLFGDRTELARDLAGQLGQGYPELVQARLALASESAGASVALQKVPSHLQRDAGLLYERLHWRRVRDDDEGAIAILSNAPDAAHVYNGKEWWKERHILIRRLIEKKQYARAYSLAANHEQLEGQPYAEAEWMAGWLSLRFLNQPGRAFQHFEKIYPKVTTPISKARAAYWMGRAGSAMGSQENARAWFQRAAIYPSTYYGQLALRQLQPKARVGQLPQVNMSSADQHKIQNGDLGRAVKLLHAAGETGLRNKFFDQLIEQARTAGEFKAIADLANDLGAKDEALRMAKKAAGKNVILVNESYPRLNVLGQSRMDKALVHAVARQESEFDAQAKSPAGAMGLMQLMPATAKQVAAKIGVQHRTEWLVTRPDHNVLLGSTYLKDLVARYDGSYPMALAAYNAGSGRVDGWIRDYGDPRKGQVDWVDWLELMPIYETRNYVQRIMEAYAIYQER